MGIGSWLIDLERGVASEAALDSKNTLFGKGPLRILELGAGIGIVSIALAALRSTSEATKGSECDHIIATDLLSAMPLLEENIANNKQYFPYTHFEATVLDWHEPLPSSIQQCADHIDVIIMADVTYNIASFPALVCTVSEIINCSANTTPPLVLLGYKERDTAERTFWDFMKGAGIELVKVAAVIGAGGAPVEIWLGRPSTGKDI